MSRLANPEALLAQFFPSTTGERGFYQNFTPHPDAQAVALESTDGRQLLDLLGLTTCLDDTGTVTEVGLGEACTELWIPVTVTLLRMGSTLFAGYWDGDGYAMVSDDNGATWHLNSDVKDASYWRTDIQYFIDTWNAQRPPNAAEETYKGPPSLDYR